MSAEKTKRPILIRLPAIAALCAVLFGVGRGEPVLPPQTLRADGYAAHTLDDVRTEVLPRAPDSTLPPPSSMPLADYEKILYRWLIDRTYATLAAHDTSWAVDKRVRDTGPFINGSYYGVHPAVRIYYSPEVKTWLRKDRQGIVADGGIIIKEMFMPPAAIYQELEQADPDGYEALLESLVTGWAVMIKDSKGSRDGWFWSSPGAPGTTFLGNRQTITEAINANLDDNSHVPFSGFGLYTCLRCHASAEKEFTFSSGDNIEGFSGTPLPFHIDNSWRNPAYTGGLLASVLPRIPAQNRDALRMRFALPDEQLPYAERLYSFIARHSPPPPSDPVVSAPPLMAPDADFVAAFSAFTAPDGTTPLRFPPVQRASVRAFPSQWSDHVFPGAGGPGTTDTPPDEFITSDTCIGCHGGLGGSPYPVTMFVKTGPTYGDGFDVAPYGEWRWSPMGLAGRDPIFHAQLESEMILLAKNANALTFPGSTRDPNDPINSDVGLAGTQKALINTCLSCHGAMGQRQLHLDAAAGRTLPGGDPLNGDFNPDYFYLTEALTRSDLESPPQPPTGEPDPPFSYRNKDDYYNYHKYGELAREGISCAVCHRATSVDSLTAKTWATGQPSAWLPRRGAVQWSDTFLYFLANNTTGQFVRSPADVLNGPFEDVAEYPMENALGITPTYDPFTASSDMCGTCHAINLPNIGTYPDVYPKPEADAVLQAIEKNPAFQSYPHSIEQATYLEWLNSDFGPGADNTQKPTFRSCQDCHMPGGLSLPRQGIDIRQLTTKIATIQDSDYPATTHTAPPEDLAIPHRDDYRRHELVGLNVFLLAMADQFPDILGVDKTDYMTSATTGNMLALENMLRQAREATVRLGIDTDNLVFDPNTNTLTADISVTNLTGHRFPSGVAFRRAFVEFLVLQNNEVIWASGRTNGIGLLVDGNEKPLPTEFLDKAGPDGRSNTRQDNRFVNYQPHYQVISSEDQAQIYEELILDANSTFTTSFIHRLVHVKDNRLLPQGWVPSSVFAKDQGAIIAAFLRATDPEGPSVVGGAPLIGPHPLPNGALTGGRYAPDPNYVDTDIGTDHLKYVVTLPAGTDASGLTVQATIYAQSLMPAWLHQRFKLAAEAKAAGLQTPETDRLYYITSHLDLSGTAMANWKLPLITATATVKAAG